MFNTILLIISSLFFRVVSLVFNIYISNKIGSEALGVFSLIMSVYMFGITFACSGINIATTKIVAEELSLSGKASAKKVGNKCIKISLITGLLSSILFFIFSDFIVSVFLHNKISNRVIYLISFILPFISMSSSINGYFAGISKVHKNVSSKFIEQVIKIISTAYLLSLFLPGTLEYACYALILGDVISEVGSFIYSVFLYYFDNSSQATKGRRYIYCEKFFKIKQSLYKKNSKYFHTHCSNLLYTFWAFYCKTPINSIYFRKKWIKLL